MPIYRRVLYYTEGSSDKEYHISLSGTVGQSDWIVAYRNGRRGCANAGSDKISNALFEDARKVFERTIREKVSKGYTLETSGEPFTTSVERALSLSMQDGQTYPPYQGDRVMQDAEDRLGIRFQRPATPEEFPLHRPDPEPVQELTPINPVRRILWSGNVRPAKVEEPVQDSIQDTIQDTLLSQQLNPITEEEVDKYLRDEEWGLQDKYNGKKVTVRVLNGNGQAFNKKGLPISIPEEVMSSILSQGIDLEVDGELIGEQYILYDLLSIGPTDLRTLSYWKRYVRYRGLKAFGPSVTLAPMYIGRDEKTDRFNAVKKANGEGVVLKRLSATFTPGRPSSGGNMLKYKFWATASCIVAHGNSQGKRSVALLLYHPDGNPYTVGNVTIPPNKEVPVRDDIVEIRYLYAYKGGSLYQPIYLGKRDDIDKQECTTSQLKYKPED